jgi:GxxExxY protein
LTGSDRERPNRLYAEVTEAIIGACYRVYNSLGSGFLESVYENALVWELSKLFGSVQRQVPLIVTYDGQQVGRCEADIVVDHKVIVELKAIESLHRIHEVQLMNYLKATGVEVGLLINFGNDRIEVRRKALQLPPLSSDPVNPPHPVIRSGPPKEQP